MQKVKLHPKIMIAHTDISDGNLDARFTPKKELKVAREKVYTELGLAANQIVEGQQIHSPRILALNSENSKMWRGTNVTGVDGFVTNQRDIALMLRVADCVPVVLYDPDHNAVGLVHAGWKGAVANIHTKAVEELVKHYQSNPKHLLVWCGPSACGKCFISTQEPQQKDDVNWKPFIKKSKGNWLVDIKGYIATSLRSQGLSKKNIKIDETCTIESLNHFSHARSQKTHEAEGRFAVIVKLS